MSEKETVEPEQLEIDITLPLEGVELTPSILTELAANERLRACQQLQLCKWSLIASKAVGNKQETDRLSAAIALLENTIRAIDAKVHTAKERMKTLMATVK